MPKNSKGREIADIIPDKCIACQLCLGQCPIGAIAIEGGVVKIDREACIGCGKCYDACPVGAIAYDKPRKKKAMGVGEAAVPISDYRGVAVSIEARDGAAAEVSWELVGKARELAGKLGTEVHGFLVGKDVTSVADEAVAYGCDVVHLLDSEAYGGYFPRLNGRAVARLCQDVKPEIVLIGATPSGRDVASVVATMLGTGLTADCTGLEVDVQERLLLMTRPTFGGNIMATILCRSHRPQMSTVRPGVLKSPARDPQRRGRVIRVAAESPEAPLSRVVEFIPRRNTEDQDISRAPALVVVGRGACDAKSLPMMHELARLMNGTIACSRPVVASGLLPYFRQVGQTGKTVAPKVYIGVAVSGAVQHLAGMQGSERVIAINTDRNAPLARMADYTLVGDYKELVPRLIEALSARVEGRAGGEKNA